MDLITSSHFRYSVPPHRHSVDRRRYSTAGNLDIYRPQSQRSHYSYDWPLVGSASRHLESVRAASTSPILYWRAPTTEYEVKKTVELPSNGTRPLTSTHVSYLPWTSGRHFLPSDLYLTSLEKQHALRSAGVPVAGRKTSDGQYEIDQYDNMLRRVFGDGVNRSKTALYTAPYTSYYSPYYSTLPRYGSSYYGGTPYYGDSYSYPNYYSNYYSPRSYYSPYYSGYGGSDYYGSSYYPSRYSYSYVI